jgi:hypothetical protein
MDDSINAMPQPTPEPPVPPAQASGSTRSSRTLLLLVIAVAVAALGTAGWLFLRHRAAADSLGASAAASQPSATTEMASSTPVQRATGVVQAATVPGSPAVVVPASSVAVDAAPATAAASEAAANSKQCSLVTRAEMEQILGAKVVRVTADELTCSYFTDETRAATVDTTWTGGKQAIAEVKGFNDGPGLFEPVPGLGDEAYMQAAGVMHVLKADTYLVVNARAYVSDHLETESAIARKALARI